MMALRICSPPAKDASLSAGLWKMMAALGPLQIGKGMGLPPTIPTPRISLPLAQLSILVNRPPSECPAT